jgi:signal transduction histidine kinase
MIKKFIILLAVFAIGLHIDLLDATYAGKKLPRAIPAKKITIAPKTVPKNLVAMNADQDDDIDIDAVEDDGTDEPEDTIRAVNREEKASAASDDFFDIAVKRKTAVDLVESGIEFLKRNDTNQTFRAFTHTKDFIKGELYLFVFNSKGVCFAHGQQSDLLWKNLINLRDSYGTPFVRDIIKKGEQGGGWITYNWRNATKVSYVQQIKKDGKIYIVGAGYYPHSKEDAVVNLVKGAVALFNDYKQTGRSKEEAFSTFNYPKGRFVLGDLYLYALDFKGTIMAQADRPGLVGTNSFDYQDEQGKFPNQEIINKLKESPEDGVWVSYISKRAVKRTYAERVEDDKGNSYFIACGFYPSADRNAAVDLVKKGYTYMKKVGKSLAVQDFSSKTNQQYRYGDLYLVVYDLQGVCIAQGENSELVGQNHWDLKDDDGRYFVREMIQKAKNGGGWIDYKIKNSFESMYVELIDLGLPENTFAIGCGVFPISKSETMNLLVKSSASFLRSNPEDIAFEEFTKKDGKFIRGDMDITVFDASGLCYASGDDYDLIWQNLINAKDDDGKAYVKILINTVKGGAGKVTYKINGVQKIAYVDKVEKTDKVFIVTSSFYK